MSGAALSPCPNPQDRADSPGAGGGAVPSRDRRLDESPVYLAPIRKELRALAQDICPLIGYLAELDDSRSLHEWAWYFDELSDKAETVQSHAMALKHMADVMWERVYATGREEA